MPFSEAAAMESSMPSPRTAPDEEVKLASCCPKKRAGRKKFKETRHPVYRGVRRRNNDRWVCELRAPNNKSRIWLGTYPSAEMAARAHDVAAMAFRGKMACLNFADSATSLPVPASGDIKDIQRAAADAAEAFRPQQESKNAREEENVIAVKEAPACSEKNLPVDNAVGYVDEEAAFDMPKLLNHMAEGMLMSPPHHSMYEDYSWDEEDESEVSLWN